MAPTNDDSEHGPRGRVIVGVDGSSNARHALAWAVAKADVLGPVTPVATFELPVATRLWGRAGHDVDLGVFRRQAENDLAEAIAATDPALAERAVVIESHPGSGLCELARDAELLVVGTKGRSAVTSALLGSVSAYCAAHATVPVAVVPESFPTDRPLTNVVVGVDGSEGAEAALRWAIERVVPSGKVFAVGALSMWNYMAGEFDPPPEVIERKVLEAVRASVDRVGGPRPDGPEIVTHVVNKDARVALRDAAGSDADLLVIGAKGLSGLAYLLLGSVASALVHHPRVPTVVIPGPERAEAGEES